jgi:hypothetical protein
MISHNEIYNKFKQVEDDFMDSELNDYIRENYKGYCPKCKSVLSFAEYHLSAPDYLGACLECDEDFYAVECEYKEDV